MSRVAYPFLTLGPETVCTSPWEVARGPGEFEPAEGYLPDWDYVTDLRVRRTVGVFRAAAAEDLDIPADDLALAVIFLAGTGPVRLPRMILRQEHRLLTDEATVEMKIPGQHLSTVLNLQTRIVLAASPLKAGELSPRKAGDRLWGDELRLGLEGEEPRFPIEVAEFGALLGDHPASYSPWYLHWSPGDWDRDFHGALRLYLNSGLPAFITRVEEEDPETLRCLLADVMGQVCEALLRNGEAADIAGRCEEGTLGHQASNWLSLAFPGDSFARMKSVLEHRPGKFRAAFLAVAEQGENET